MLQIQSLLSKKEGENMTDELSIKKVPTPQYWISRGRPQRFPELEQALDDLALNETVAVKCLDYHVRIPTRNTDWCPVAGRSLTLSRSKDYKVLTMHRDNQLYIKKVERK